MIVLTGMSLQFPGCRNPKPVEKSPGGQYQFSRPYSDESTVQKNTNERTYPKVNARKTPCVEGKKKTQKGNHRIKDAAQKLSTTLQKKKNETSYMSFLYAHESSLTSSGEIRDKGMKKLINGLYLLYHLDENERYRTHYETIDQLLKKERTVSHAVQEKRNGLFSDFKGIYKGLNKLARVQKKLTRRVHTFLSEYDCDTMN